MQRWSVFNVYFFTVYLILFASDFFDVTNRFKDALCLSWISKFSVALLKGL